MANKFMAGGYEECAVGRHALKCLRSKAIPSSNLTGTFPDLTGKAGTVYVTESLVGPVAATTTNYKAKCATDSKQKCPVQLVFPPGVGPALRLCGNKDPNGTVVPVKTFVEMQQVEAAYCNCASGRSTAVRQKCARSVSHGI